MVKPHLEPPAVTDVEVDQVDLRIYDQLLEYRHQAAEFPGVLNSRKKLIFQELRCCGLACWSGSDSHLLCVFYTFGSHSSLAFLILETADAKKSSGPILPAKRASARARTRA
jgi:hypothetical protein